MKNKLLIYPVLLIVTAIWGYSFVAIKQGIQYVTAFELVAFRFIPCVICFYLLIHRRRMEFWRMIRQEWKIFIFLGLCSVVIYHSALNYGEEGVPAGIASMIIALNPVFVLILSAALKLEKPAAIRWAGMLLAFLGLYFAIASSSHIGFSADYLTYALLILLSASCFATVTVFTKPLLKKYDPLFVTCGTMIVGGAPTVLFLTPRSVMAIPSYPLVFWVSVLFLAILCTVVAFIGWNWALQQIKASQAASFTYFTPLFSLVFSRFFLNEPLTFGILLGAALLIIGLVLVNMERKQARPLVSAEAAGTGMK